MAIFQGSVDDIESKTNKVNVIETNSAEQYPNCEAVKNYVSNNKFRLINSMTVEEGQAPTAFQFTEDKDFYPLALRRFIVVAEIYQPYVGNGYTFNLSSVNEAGVTVKLTKKWIEAKKYNCFVIDVIHSMGVTRSITSTNSSDTDAMPLVDSYPYAHIVNEFADDELITNITLAVGFAMGAGSHIEIWGY